MSNFRIHVTTFRGIPKARILERLGSSCQCEKDTLAEALLVYDEIVQLIKAIPSDTRYPFVGVVMVTDTVNGVVKQQEVV